MISIEITCEEKWQKAVEAASEHDDKTLDNCIVRLLHWLHGRAKKITISRDYGEHCFFFSEIYEDGSVGICGGIVFHGFKENGYQENGSVMAEPTCGWQIHT